MTRETVSVTRRRVAGAAVALALLVWSGCAAEPRGGARPAESLPAISELRSQVTAPGPPSAGDAGARRPALVLHRLTLPVEEDAGPLWALVQPAGVGPGLAAAWADNGLRVGVLPRAELPRFLDRLPGVARIGRVRLIGGDHPLELEDSPRLAAPVAIHLPQDGAGPDAEPPVYLAEDGRLRLLVLAPERAGSGAVVNLLPHHYLPEPSLMPRDPLDKELDGRVLTELALPVSLGPDRLLVIGLSASVRRALPPRPGTDAASRDDASTDPPPAGTAGEPGPAPTEDRVPRNLGTLLLLGGDRQSPRSQLLLLLTLEGPIAP